MIAGFLWAILPEDQSKCFLVRNNVFVKEQGFSEENEFDEIDQVAHHLLFLDDERPVAAARLYDSQDEWHIGRVCTLKQYRSKGIGRFLIQECIAKAQELNHTKPIVLGAQIHVQSFYEKLGFSAVGQPYLDEHCPHIRMEFVQPVENSASGKE